ncbi:hypothetical protein PQR67_24130 [Paraburkholderia fungorum]|uniref:hypothetical protein n=1 Tax=Paraburkholderia fungorum TaxID=134537 RepID=UPI0038B75FC8
MGLPTTVSGRPILLKKSLRGFFNSLARKSTISDRPACRSRTPAEGEKTPENLATEAGNDFFNSIDPKQSLEPMRFKERKLNKIGHCVPSLRSQRAHRAFQSPCPRDALNSARVSPFVRATSL